MLRIRRNRRQRQKRPDTTNPAAPVPGENSFTEAQAKERMEGKGYSDVTALTKGEAASAMKSGKAYEVK